MATASGSATYSALLDQGIQCTDTAPVTSGHPIHLVHDQDGLIRNLHSHDVRFLAKQSATSCGEGTDITLSPVLKNPSKEVLLIFVEL